MARVYKSFPIKEEIRDGVTCKVPDMGAQNIPFERFEPGRNKVRGTDTELDTLEVDTNWILL